ncbi:TPR-like protein [Fomitiporia mediterranea MF3/22]|uniref:TPR-like protein n=1 Tax=Fomitiporia mediterranea (strain MF3/22) TaxID=694068 RepID=UPI0004409731|nr:TPR-like protein [Fomitiporia mediterranea MF3/22]EJD07143.1 TPR-like protein [Fomitiporia mediterranea MF3/22]
MDYALTALDAAKYIHGLIEKHSKNRKTLMDVSLRLVDDIQCLEDIRDSCGIGDSIPELDEEIAAYQNDLNELLDDCRKLFEEKPGFRRKVKHFYKTRINVGDIEEKLIEFEKRADLAQRRFENKNQINIRVELRHIHARLMSPAAELERSLGNQMVGQRNWRGLDQEEEVQIQIQEDEDADCTDSQEEPEDESSKGFKRLGGESRYREGGQKWKQDKSSEDGLDEGGLGDMELLTPDFPKSSLDDGALSVGSEEGSVDIRSHTTDVSNFSPREKLQNEPWENDSDEESSNDMQSPTPEVSKAASDDESEGQEEHIEPQECIEESQKREHSKAKVQLKRTTMTKDEAVQETLKLLNDIRDPDSRTPVTTWISKANKLAITLEQKLDMLSEALQLSEMCASLTRQLTDEYPSAFRPLLASNLRSLAKRLWKNRQPDQALEHSEEAVSLYRQLVIEDPEAYEPELASALMTYALDLSGVRRNDEALEPMEETVKIRRVLVERNPTKYTFDLAESLKNYSILLLKLRRGQDALNVRREVVELQEELAKQDPKKYKPYLAMALKILCSRLSGAHEYQQALKVQVRHARVRREISEKDLEKHAEYIIRKLLMYSSKLADRKLREDALQAAEEAVDLAEWLAKDDAHNHRLGEHDNDSDNSNDELDDDGGDGDGDDKESEGSSDSELNPHAALLAEAFTALSDRLYVMKRDEQALKAILRAADLWDTLRKHDSGSGKCKFNFVRSLDKLSQRQSVLGLHEKALKTANRAVEQWEALAQSNDRHLPHLGRAYEMLSLRLSKLGQQKDALNAIESSIEIFKELVEQKPRWHEPGLAQSLVTQSIAFAKAGRRKEALVSAEEAVTIYRRLAKDNPKVYKQKLASSLHEYAVRLSLIGRKERAHEVVTEAIDIYKQLAKDSPDKYGKIISKSTDLRIKLKADLVKSSLD